MANRIKVCLNCMKEAMHEPNICTDEGHVRPRKALLELKVQRRKSDVSRVFAAFALVSRPTILLSRARNDNGELAHS